MQQDSIRGRYLDVDGLRVYCRYSEGGGPPVVLLQGGMLDSSTLTWRYTLEALPPRYRVFAPDLPGYGSSDKPEARYTTDYYIDFLRRFIDGLGLGRVHLFGSSMSGAVALGLALQAPERVASLVLSGAYGWQPRLPFHRLAYLAAHLPGLPQLVVGVLRQGPAVMRLALRLAIPNAQAVSDDLVEDACRGVAQGGQLRAFFDWLRSELRPTTVRTNFTGVLHCIEQPVLILHGARDWMMPLRYARRARARLPHAALHTFEHGGHMVPREYPDAVNRLVIDFLRRVEEGEGAGEPESR